MLNRIEVAIPGWLASVRQGVHVKSWPPMAGRYPNAGSSVPIKPAATGRMKSAIVSHGAPAHCPADPRLACDPTITRDARDGQRE